MKWSFQYHVGFGLAGHTRFYSEAGVSFVRQDYTEADAVSLCAYLNSRAS